MFMAASPATGRHIQTGGVYDENIAKIKGEKPVPCAGLRFEERCQEFAPINMKYEDVQSAVGIVPRGRVVKMML